MLISKMLQMVSSQMKTNSIKILYEDNHLIAVNKPAGVPVQDDETGDKSLVDMITDYIREEYNKPGNIYAGLIHRIDRPVSGVVLFAKTSKAASRLSEMFKTRSVNKTYLAVVQNYPPELKGTLEHYLIKDSEKNKSNAYSTEKKGAKKSVLHYELVGSSTNYHLLEIELETGRHHQIRCQLAKVGCPVRGDLKYGAPRSNPNGNINLHSWKLFFEHPVKKEKIEIIAPLPKDDNLWKEFNNLINLTL